MSHRNRFTSQLSGVKFNGITTEQAAGILMQWKQTEVKPNNSDNESKPKIREHHHLEIPKKIVYLDNWGEYSKYSRYNGQIIEIDKLNNLKITHVMNGSRDHNEHKMHYLDYYFYQ